MKGTLPGAERLRITSRIGAEKLYKVVRFALLFGLQFMILYPILFMIVSAFRGVEDMSNPSVIWVTRHWTLDNFKLLFKSSDIWGAIQFTTAVSLTSALVQTAVCSMVGYGFARYDFWGKKILFGILMFSIVVPPQTYIVALFGIIKDFRIPIVGWIFSLFGSNIGTVQLIDSPAAFWVQCLFGMGFRSGLFIYIFRQFYRGLPRELDEAATIDGCGHIKTFLRVMLPNAIPAMVTVFMFSLVWHWSEYFVSSVLTATKQTISVALATLRPIVEGQYTSGSGISMVRVQMLVQAGSLITIAPMLILFMFAQKFFTQGMERTGIVG